MVDGWDERIMVLYLAPFHAAMNDIQAGDSRRSSDGVCKYAQNHTLLPLMVSCAGSAHLNFRNRERGIPVLISDARLMKRVE